MKHIIVIFGTRPEAIMMAPLVKELQKYPDQYRLSICSTGQHQKMVEQILLDFELSCDYSLDISTTKSMDMTDIASTVMAKVRDILKIVLPDYCMVIGDTNSSMGAALAAFYLQIPVLHLQAGLRTNDINNPYPNEANRQLISRIAHYHFAPTVQAKINLVKENISTDKILVTGDTVIDALHWILKKTALKPSFEKEIRKQIIESGYDISRLDLAEDPEEDTKINNGKKMVLVTGYRHENYERFDCIMNSLEAMADKFPNIDFVYPLRSKDKIGKIIKENKELLKTPNLFFIEQIGYGSFIYMMKKCSLILTDSGLIQEEAPALGKPVLLMRERTERPEGIAAGTVMMVGTDAEIIVNEVTSLLSNQDHYNEMSRAINPYGDGLASQRILKKLSEIL